MTEKKVGESVGEVKIVPTGCVHDCGGRCVLKAHVKDHQSLYNRVEIDLGRTEEAQLAMPIDQRLQAIQNGKAQSPS